MQQVIGTPVGIVSASVSLAFSSFTGIVKKLLKTTRNKKEKHDKTIVLARSKLNCRDSKISDTLINSKISHADFITIINEEKNIKNQKKALEWWIDKEVILKKLI